MIPNEEGDDGSEEPGEGKATYVGIDSSEGRGLVFVLLSGKRGDGGIEDNGGIGDNGSTVDDEKLDSSMSILECRIKYLGM